MDGASDDLKKLEEMLKSMDGDSSPSHKEIFEMLEQSEMDEELKENLKSMLTGSAPQLFAGYGGGTYLGIAFVVLIFTVLFFFGYKLYKSIKDKEKKREEKKKAKQMKKKK